MELSYYISEIRQALPLDWPHIDDRMVTRLINEFRTVYIKNHYNQNRTIDRGLTQTINLEVAPADQSTVSYISTTDRVLKSVAPIPKIVKLSHRDLVIAARNANILSENYNYVTKEQAIYAGSGKVNKRSIFVFVDNNDSENDYLYVKLKEENPSIAMLTHVNIQAIFEDPLECKIFHHPTEYIDDRDYEYPMIDTIWGYIKSNILKDGLGIIQADVADGKEKEV